MTTASFTRQVYVSDIPQPAKSVGAHLSAKLQLFRTDERTLTDELCDMLCIWLAMQAHHPTQGAGSSFKLTLGKTTCAEEVRNGADLELVVSSPLGSKRCLIQAKVLDPLTGKLRCDSKSGWTKLRTQLSSARREVGDLAFLLVYVPASVLNGRAYGYNTYEQTHNILASGQLPAFFGATLIAANDLLDANDRWRDRKLKVVQRQPGRFDYGIAFWRLLMELLFCRRSVWQATTPGTKPHVPPSFFRRLTVSASGIDAEEWNNVQESAGAYLPSDEEADRASDEQ
jgi:hypothetical protein